HAGKPGIGVIRKSAPGRVRSLARTSRRARAACSLPSRSPHPCARAKFRAPLPDEPLGYRRLTLRLRAKSRATERAAVALDGVANACPTHPADAIGAGVIEPAIGLDQHVEAHQQAEDVLAALVVDHRVIDDQPLYISIIFGPYFRRTSHVRAEQFRHHIAYIV